MRPNLAFRAAGFAATTMKAPGAMDAFVGNRNSTAPDKDQPASATAAGPVLCNSTNSTGSCFTSGE